MIVHDVPQGSYKWDLLRMGLPTASNFHRILTPKTMQVSEQSVRYMNWLLAEWMIGEPLESPETQWMQRGVALEDQAVRSYCFEANAKAERVGFVTLDNGTAGCSPDRFVTTVKGKGILEIKCPSPQVHVGHMIRKELDDDHKAQVQGQMWICQMDWSDVISYCPALPTVIIRAHRDEKYISMLKGAIAAFWETMIEARLKLSREYGPFVREEVKRAVDESPEPPHRPNFFDTWRPI